jgi:hypothetical protein
VKKLRTSAARALADLAPLLADSSRLAKGRTYNRRGEVGELVVEPGVVRADVSGSRSFPYEVTISTRAAPVHVAEEVATYGWEAAVPESRDIAFDCTCPDWGDPCKHAVAVLYCLAEAVDDDPGVLATWRSLNDQADRQEAPTSPGAEVAPPGGEVIELGRALASLISRSNDPALRRSAAAVLASLEHEGVRAGGDLAPPNPVVAAPVDEALAAFFDGGVPEGGPLLESVELAVLPNPYARLAITIEGVDAAPVLSDALTAVSDLFGSL